MRIDKFHDISNGNPRLEAWLKGVDDLCLRFLDTDLLSIPEAAQELEEPYPDLQWVGSITPLAYFRSLLGCMKQQTSSVDIDRHFARMTIWGDQATGVHDG